MRLASRARFSGTTVSLRGCIQSLETRPQRIRNAGKIVDRVTFRACFCSSVADQGAGSISQLLPVYRIEPSIRSEERACHLKTKEHGSTHEQTSYVISCFGARHRFGRGAGTTSCTESTRPTAGGAANPTATCTDSTRPAAVDAAKRTAASATTPWGSGTKRHVEPGPAGCLPENLRAISGVIQCQGERGRRQD